MLIDQTNKIYRAPVRSNNVPLPSQYMITQVPIHRIRTHREITKGIKSPERDLTIKATRQLMIIKQFRHQMLRISEV